MLCPVGVFTPPHPDFLLAAGQGLSRGLQERVWTRQSCAGCVQRRQLKVVPHQGAWTACQVSCVTTSGLSAECISAFAGATQLHVSKSLSGRCEAGLSSTTPPLWSMGHAGIRRLASLRRVRVGMRGREATLCTVDFRCLNFMYEQREVRVAGEALFMFIGRRFHARRQSGGGLRPSPNGAPPTASGGGAWLRAHLQGGSRFRLRGQPRQ
ncbi:hypothetical protein QFZ69_004718 [Arthrobacter sp. V1I7]|nr:hypothetical protein [Arthrobacter sp. V1I7]